MIHWVWFRRGGQCKISCLWVKSVYLKSFQGCGRNFCVIDVTASLVTPPLAGPPYHSFPRSHITIFTLWAIWSCWRLVVEETEGINFRGCFDCQCSTTLVASDYPLLSDWGRPGHQLNHQNPPYLQPTTSQRCNMPRCYTSHRKHSTLRCQMFR